MFDYLVTPQYVLGSDSFSLRAKNDEEAKQLAIQRMQNEGWGGGTWEIYRKITTFEAE
jgi:hypothetical protein